jgi:hypothetical protein
MGATFSEVCFHSCANIMQFLFNSHKVFFYFLFVQQSTCCSKFFHCFVYCCFTRHYCHRTFLQNTCQHFAHNAYFVKALQINTSCSTAYIHYWQWPLSIRYKAQLNESVAGTLQWLACTNLNFPSTEPDVKDAFCITVIFDSKFFFSFDHLLCTNNVNS